MSSALEPADEQLVSLSKDGNLEAFNSLVERFQGVVYNLCLRLLGNPESAEDAAQETFLAAYQAISRFAEGSFRSWLLRIAANESKDELRRRKRRGPANSLDLIPDNDDGPPLELADSAPGAPILAERRELAAELQAILMGIPFDQRQAVVLSDLYGFRYEEIASLVGANVGTVKSRIHRGRERLRQEIAIRPEQFPHSPRLSR
jgi:RNA polymerase sigma-70 factor (ECF subfamily)